MNSVLERNKRNVQEFYSLAFNDCEPRKAVERYTGADYIQHNPGVVSGKQGFIDYFEKLAKEYPGKKVHFVRTIAEGDLVVVHTRQEWPGFNEWASVDIFRCDADGKIVEHWDVLQEVPTKKVNNNTMF